MFSKTFALAVAAFVASSSAFAVEQMGHTEDLIDNGKWELVFPSEYNDMILFAGRDYGNGDYDKAFPQFMAAACAGDKQSQSAIGRMYLLGRGVKQNDLIGFAWLSVAAEFVFPKYQVVVNELQKAMTPTQRSVADPLAKKLLNLYGLAATNISCQKQFYPDGSTPEEIVCTPQRQGDQFKILRCVPDAY